MTIAPCSPSRFAVARPIPRDAPVTSATLPVRLNIDGRFDRCEIVGGAETDDGRRAMNLADHSAEHRARTHLNIRCDAFRRKALDHGLPSHGRRYLPDQRLDGRVRLALRLRVDIRHDRDARTRG